MHDYDPAPAQEGIMRFRPALAVFALAVLMSEGAAAQAPTWYCDAPPGYYPWVRFCPSGWRPVNPAAALPQPYTAPPSGASTVPGDYRSTLSNWLESHKRYPESARQRGEVGRAVLRFRVDRTGRVLNYALASGTGYPDLDAAVEDMMRNASLPPFPPGMTTPEIEVSVTVAFGLGQATALPSMSAPATATPMRSGADIDDELSGWCAEVSKPSSIVICADRDLRQMAMIRNKIFADAKPIVSADAYKQLLTEQTQWVQTYSSPCGVAADGPEPSQPISSSVIDCFKRESQKRIADLVSRLDQQKAGYSPTGMSSVQTALVAQALRQRADDQKAEQQRQQAAAAEQAEREKRQQEQDAALEVERARVRLRAQALADRQAALEQKLKDGGYKMESPIDFELDWRDLRASAQKVAVQGSYMESDDVEGLVISNKDLPLIRLYTDDASRDARKLMLECRLGNYIAPSCKLIVAARVVTCVRNKNKTNEKEIPCLQVEDAFVTPTADQ